MCYSCHVNIRAQFDMPSHHRINEGFMTCTDCHNPHGAFASTVGMGQNRAMLVRAEDTEQPCFKCHIDKRGPFVFVHPSVAVEGCQMCHYPHGSMNARL